MPNMLGMSIEMDKYIFTPYLLKIAEVPAQGMKGHAVVEVGNDYFHLTK